MNSKQQRIDDCFAYMLDAFKVMKELNKARFLLKKNYLCTDDIDIKINQQEKVLLHLSIDYIELKQ